jgi:hypothetical protein
MKAIERIEEFRNLAFGPQEPPNWWQTLKGEVRQGRSDGRYLEKTLELHLEKAMKIEEARSYRSKNSTNRRQYFFSKGGNIDGRYFGIGVEEKCAPLTRDKLLDGVLCRGLVWTLGNPQDVAHEELGATGIFVALEGSPLAPDLAGAFFGAVVLAREASVYPFFVDGKGRHWPKDIADRSAPPEWLVESIPAPSTVPVDAAAVEALDSATWAQPDRSLFGSKNNYHSTSVLDGVRVAMAEWSNEWQMIDVGLMLRAMGHAAVKVRYSSKKILKPGGRGVERKVAKEMRERFGVILDWRVDH